MTQESQRKSEWAKAIETLGLGQLWAEILMLLEREARQ